MFVYVPESFFLHLQFYLFVTCNPILLPSSCYFFLSVLLHYYIFSISLPLLNCASNFLSLSLSLSFYLIVLGNPILPLAISFSLSYCTIICSLSLCMCLNISFYLILPQFAHPSWCYFFISAGCFSETVFLSSPKLCLREKNISGTLFELTQLCPSSISFREEWVRPPLLKIVPYSCSSQTWHRLSSVTTLWGNRLI